MDLILVFHIGAGKHSVQQTRNYKRLLRAALSARDLIEASCIIEKSHLTNTGFGSSVDRTCTANSDASLLEVSGGRIVNSLALLNIHDDAFPIACVDLVARLLNHEYAVGGVNRCFGLSKPFALDYKIYKQYCETSREAVKLVSDAPKALVLRGMHRAFERFQSIFERERSKIDARKLPNSNVLVPDGLRSKDAEEMHSMPAKPAGVICKRRKPNPERSAATDPVSILDAGVEDTVGFIEISGSPDVKTRLASSSGGNFYRMPGRASCAGIVGSGIAYSSHRGVEVSCMCSGNGDDIIAMSLASYLSETIAETLGNTQEWPELGPLVESRILRKSQQVAKTAVNARLEEITYVGVVMVVRSAIATRLVFCHSTESFYFAFRLQGMKEVVLSWTDRPCGEFLSGEYKLG